MALNELVAKLHTANIADISRRCGVDRKTISDIRDCITTNPGVLTVGKILEAIAAIESRAARQRRAAEKKTARTFKQGQRKAA